MKKSVKILTLVMALIMICLPLTACFNNLSGKYENKTILGTSTYEFKGNKFTYEDDLGIELEGTYKIKDDKIYFEFKDLDEDEQELMDELYGDGVDFKKTDDGIKIAGVEYEKAD
jgi:uncharacterized lipoprotein YehR (DUF1307 family)